MSDMFWDRNGQVIEDTIEWAKKFEDSEMRIVSVDQDGPGLPMVSTIWQGLDLAHNVFPGAIPMIFETAILLPEIDSDQGAIHERDFSATEEQALETHAEYCRRFLGREPMPNNGLKAEILKREGTQRGKAD